MEQVTVVVTDDPDVRIQLNRILANHGNEILFTDHGSKAILSVLENEIGMLIYDLSADEDSMINMIEVVHRTKPKLPIIVLSDTVSLDKMRRLSELGVFYCAMRPVQTAEMEKVVEAVRRLYEREKMEYQKFQKKEV